MIVLKWQHIRSQTSIELHYANSLVSTSTQSLLSQKESLLRVMGERLLELGSLKKTQQAQLLINELLSRNPELAGFGLVNTSGQLLLTSFNTNQSKPPNLLTQKDTASTFREALKSEHMVIGHTYFMKALNQWVIPLRARITDHKGNVYAVMTTGLKLNNNYSPWNKQNLPNNIDLSIIRDDFYRIYGSYSNPTEHPEHYNKAIPLPMIKEFSSELKRQTGETFKSLKKDHKVIEMLLIDSIKRRSISVSSFNSEYKILITTLKPFKQLLNQMIMPVIWILSLIIIFNISLYFLFRNNFTLQKNSENKLKFQAEHDQLTQLPNRYYLNRRFQSWSNRHKQYAILFIDLNNFKTANDLYGHSVGDKILIEVTSRIKVAFQNSLHIRQGGDEFTILLTNKDSINAIDICKQFLYTLKYPIKINENVFSIGASIGIAHYPQDGTNLEELLRKADLTMYDAKKQTSNISLFNTALEDISKHRSLIEKELEHAIRRNEFFMVYQPQIDSRNNQIIGVEALIRWNNKTLGTVPPDEFITIAESTGLIHSIGQYVINTAIRDIQAIQKRINKNNKSIHPIRLSINISVQQLLNKDFYSSILSLISQHDHQKIELMFEVTESLFIDDIELAKSILIQLRQHNISISLDDFGTGYSSLSVLTQLPINELKIDKSFVDDILIDQQDLMLVQNIISIGNSMEILVLAEGVENIEQVEVLKEAGCNLYQGFYFAKPMRKEDLEFFLQDFSK